MKNPFKKEKLLDSFECQRELAKELDTLLERAGIKEQYEHEERIFEPDFFADRHLPPLFTQARKRVQKTRQATNAAIFKAEVRRLVFGVADEALRKEIIACLRKQSALTLDSIQRRLQRAIRDRNNAGYMTGSYMFNLALLGAVIVIGTWHWGGATWGTAATAFVVIVAVYDAFQRQFSMRRAIESATEEIENSEADIDVHLEGEIFDEYEEDTGKEFKSFFETQT